MRLEMKPWPDILGFSCKDWQTEDFYIIPVQPLGRHQGGNRRLGDRIINQESVARRVRIDTDKLSRNLHAVVFDCSNAVPLQIMSRGGAIGFNALGPADRNGGAKFQKLIVAWRSFTQLYTCNAWLEDSDITFRHGKYTINIVQLMAIGDPRGPYRRYQFSFFANGIKAYQGQGTRSLILKKVPPENQTHPSPSSSSFKLLQASSFKLQGTPLVAYFQSFLMFSRGTSCQLDSPGQPLRAQSFRNGTKLSKEAPQKDLKAGKKNSKTDEIWLDTDANPIDEEAGVYLLKSVETCKETLGAAEIRIFSDASFLIAPTDL
ncbi:hypothetical protein FIBSPDRAFT_933566 [Athelia psychrophila]|uniref:Uncharacterized protein n=1 Tax=Athelia psychrophila TaxID=1759441 RepID=A0A166GYU3_9AGAM|nr:hypothetical protein FIBSPDRAFT_933566 [Fibularhizoctonia sp. CBS 109695]